MTTKQRASGRLRRLGASTLAAGVVFAVLGLAAGPAGADKPEDKGKPDRETFKVTICHRDNNEKQPYGPKPIEVSVSAGDGTMQNGPDHTGHTGPVFAPGMKDDHIDWGDIIPPYEWPGGSFLGMNWDDAGQEIWKRDCQLPGDEDPECPTAPAETAAAVVIDEDPCDEDPECPTAPDETAAAVVLDEDPCDEDPECPEGTEWVDGNANKAIDPGECEQPCIDVISTDLQAAAVNDQNPCDPPDACDNVAGIQESTRECPPPPPPFDQCDGIPGTQAAGTDCSPPPPADECPDDQGLQTNADQCTVPEVEPQVITPTPTPTPAPVSQVKGEVIVKAPAQLPRTGNDVQPLLEVGIGLILLGAGAMLFGRERPAAIA